MSEHYDAIVVGGGHNGLVCASVLARAGRRVLLAEARDRLGGLAAAEHLQGDVASVGLLQDTTGLRPRVLSELELERHGLKLRSRSPDVLALGDEGRSLLLHAETDRAATAIRALSERDARTYPRWREFLRRVRGPLAGFLDRSPVELITPERADLLELARRGLGLRRLGRDRMLELLRLPPMPVVDWLGEWFEDPLLVAALAMPAVAGTPHGPRSPWTTLNLLLHETGGGPGVVGGGPALVDALERCARHHGVTLRTECAVRGLSVEAGRVRGVRLDDGNEIGANVVAASCHPSNVFLDLLDANLVELRLERRARQYRSRGTTAEVMLALDRPLRFDCVPGETVELARIAADCDALERAHDAIKYGRLADRPALEIHQPETIADGPTRIGVLVHFAPYVADETDDAALRERLAETVVGRIEEHSRGFAASVTALRVRTPRDLERELALPGGQIHHGEHASDQLLVRPFAGCAHYATPVGGLFLCGAGSHPGGGLTGGPGLFAAETILASG